MRVKVIYSKEYVISVGKKENAVGIADQKFTFDIREMLSRNGSGKICYLFDIKEEIMKKNDVFKQK